MPSYAGLRLCQRVAAAAVATAALGDGLRALGGAGGVALRVEVARVVEDEGALLLLAEADVVALLQLLGAALADVLPVDRAAVPPGLVPPREEILAPVLAKQRRGGRSQRLQRALGAARARTCLRVSSSRLGAMEA